MAPRRLIAAAALLGFGLNLASCGGFVADHWPHWAGGLPSDAPPRPGTPGYAEVQTDPQQVAPAPAAAAPQPAPGRAAAPDNDTMQDSGAVKGGLY
jgi:hypothetical protein